MIIAKSNLACDETNIVDPHQVDADPDSTYQPDADPDPYPDPSFQLKAQTLKKYSNWRIFHTFWLVTSKLMQIRF
jgi:hypothetical protein